MDACEQEMEAGPCRGAIPRWFFNSEEEKCERFIYGGCQGNKNNFESEEKCKARCIRIPVCQQPMVVGRCKAALKRFFYNMTSMACEEFTYGGCDANGNNFEAIEECQKICEKKDEEGGLLNSLELINPLLHRYLFLHLLQQTTFANIVAKEEIAPAKNVHFFQQSEHSRFF